MRLPKNKMMILLVVVVISMVIYQLISTQKILMSSIEHYNVHLGFALIVIFFAALEKSENKIINVLLLLAVLLSILVFVYIHVLNEELQIRSYFNTSLDIIIGGFLIVLCIIATWVSFGPTIPILTILVLIYSFVGQYLQEPFHIQDQSLQDTITNLTVSLDGGIFSMLLPISANYVFLYIVFGGLLVATGATNFFLEVGKFIGSKFRGGPGIAAVLSSALVGSISGSAAANIAITGSFTIPLMKKVGYKPYQAGAIEAAASTGGCIMPPIMGSIAFIMSGLTGISYLNIIKMALIPAILYFFSVFLYVLFRSAKLQIAIVPTKIIKKDLLISAPMFFGPLIIIVALLIAGYTVGFVAFWAVMSVIVIPLITKKTRPSIGKYIEGFVRGATAGAGIAAMLAILGLVYTTFTFSGIGIKLSAGIMEWSGGMLLPALIIIEVIAIFSGMLGVGVASYVVVSIFGVAALMKMGIGLGVAHFFIVYTTIFGFVTPPIAGSAIVSSKLAGAPYMRTAIESGKIAIAGFILPYLFILSPVLLMHPQPLLTAAMGIIVSIISVLVLQIAIVGHYFIDCHLVERILSIFIAALFFASLILESYILFSLGLFLFVMFTLWQWNKKRSVNKKAISNA